MFFDFVLFFLRNTKTGRDGCCLDGGQVVDGRAGGGPSSAEIVDSRQTGCGWVMEEWMGGGRVEGICIGGVRVGLRKYG